MDGVYSWVKSIVFYLVFLTVVTHLVPNRKFEKYVRLFTGMILILVVIKPVMGLLSSEHGLERKLAALLDGTEGFLVEESYRGKDWESYESESMEKLCIRQVESFVTSLAEQYGLQVQSVSVKAKNKDYMYQPSIIKIQLIGPEEEKEPDEIRIADIVAGIRENSGEDGASEQPSVEVQLKRALAKYYEIEEEQVQIIES